MGYPLSQTLFTSIHIDRLLWPYEKLLADVGFSRGSLPPDSAPLVNLVLRCYCLMLIKCCDLIHATVTSQHYYEVGRPLAADRQKTRLT